MVILRFQMQTLTLDARCQTRRQQTHDAIAVLAGAANHRSFSILPPPPVLRCTHPLACKSRGGMIIISTHEIARRSA